MNSQEIIIQVLVENTANRVKLLGEHGLSYRIQTQGRSSLFDTGQGFALAHNASVLGVDLNRIDSIVLSHGHYDHTQGIRFFSKQTPRPTIYAHPDALQEKFARRQDNQYASVGLAEEWISPFKEKLIWTEQPTQILDDIWVTGPIPRQHEQERISGPFFLDDQGRQADELKDDQSIYFQTQQGVVVLLGCAHAGVINILQYIEKITGGTGIHAVIGGMHLVNASAERIQWTIQELRRMNVMNIAPCHCTGGAACHALRNAFKDQFEECSVGTEFKFDRI